MNVIEVVQGTPEWLAARAGNVTASKITDVMAKARNGSQKDSVTRRNYLYQVAAERLSGKPCEDGFKNGHTDRGNELEECGRTGYELLHDVMVEQVGFVLHPSIANYGCSPDGLVGSDGMIQIKCPIIAIHCQYMTAGEVPAEYVPQMLSEMDTCDREWSDFVSYCKHLPAPLNLFVKRLYRDDKRIAEIRDAVEQFNAEVQEMVDKLKRL
jgi:hypothetical protein